MFIVGLTGGIGSGKSTAANFFTQLGVEIVDADSIAREVVAIGQASLNTIAEHFGDSILLADGSLNRPRLREIIFADATEKRWLEALLHPLIYSAAQNHLHAARGDYVIYMSPLIFESQQKNWCHRIVAVDISETLQLERARLRDNSTDEEIRRIINTQLSRAARLAAADDIIDNSGTPDDLQQHVRALHEQLLKMAANYPKELHTK
jgi:dephospho-CoA kinase